MDFMIDKIAWLLDKFGSKIPSINIPWHKFGEFMAVVNPYLAQANVIFPVDAVLQCMVIYGVLRAILMIIWAISFVRKLLPF